MSFQDFMNRIRYWDQRAARWLMRHFYFTFFQIILLIIFTFWFYNTFHVIEVAFRADQKDTVENLLTTQSINMTIIVLLLLVNSFWSLYMFNLMQRINSNIKDLTFSSQKIRSKLH